MVWRSKKKLNKYFLWKNVKNHKIWVKLNIFFLKSAKLFCFNNSWLSIYKFSAGTFKIIFDPVRLCDAVCMIMSNNGRQVEREKKTFRIKISRKFKKKSSFLVPTAMTGMRKFRMHKDQVFFFSKKINLRRMKDKN